MTIYSVSFSRPCVTLQRPKARHLHDHVRPMSSMSMPCISTTKTTTMYDVLSVGKSAGQDEIKTAFRKLARRWHPDTCRRTDEKEYFAGQFIKVHEAYRVLSDPVLREDYDYRLMAKNGTYYENFPMKKTRKNCGFGNWISQLDGLRKKSEFQYGRACSSTWGSRMRASRAA